MTIKNVRKYYSDLVTEEFHGIGNPFSNEP